MALSTLPTVAAVASPAPADAARIGTASHGTPSDLQMKVQFVMNELEPTAPHYLPKHVAPVLGFTADAFSKVLRKMPELRSWSGFYCFQTDDPEHMAILRKAIGKVLWSGLKVPAHLRPKARG